MTSYKIEQFLDRAEFIDKQVETWKGSAGYADTLRMEAWSLRTAAAIAGAGKWLPPISTAPRDGSEILLVSIQPQDDGMAYISISNGSWSAEAGHFVLGPKGSKFNSIGDGCATHWLPVDWLFATPVASDAGWKIARQILDWCTKRISEATYQSEEMENPKAWDAVKDAMHDGTLASFETELSAAGFPVGGEGKRP
jgi:hypothetical protein